MGVSELIDNQEIDTVLLIKDVRQLTKRDGDPYLKLELGDTSGKVSAPLWDSEAVENASSIAEAFDILKAGVAVHITGKFNVHERYGAQLKLTRISVASDGEYEISELVESAPVSLGEMESQLRELLATITNQHLKQLLDLVFAPDSEIWQLYSNAPAAKYYHQAYQHGLLEHCLTVAQSVSSLAKIFPGIDHDTAVTGALLHDIGKLEAYTTDPGAIDLTDDGKLQGEIPLGYYRIRKMIEAIPDFPYPLQQAVLHIILSHHGMLEHGSPVVPCTREATLVHMADNIGGRLGSYDRIERELRQGQNWSDFDRGLGISAYFAEKTVSEK